MAATPPPAGPRPYAGIADLYHAYLTGLLLMVISRRGADDAARLVFALFRQQHLDLFLPGLRKLGLDGEPDAVAAAKYHYFSNQLGGVKVEYLRESARKAWVRYPPPRWIWEGTAICAVPSNVSRAMLRGWHAHNGVSLGNPRLGFVCTKQTVDGQPGLEGYYLEHERPLEPDERLRFAPGEEMPAVDTAALPRLDSDSWPTERRDKAYRNYAMAYIRTVLPLMPRLFGPAEGGALAAHAARLIGMQQLDSLVVTLGHDPTGPEGFASLLRLLLEAQGETVEVRADGASATVVQRRLRLFADLSPPPPRETVAAWVELFRGLLAASDRFLELRCDWLQDAEALTWTIAPRAAGALTL